MSFSSRNIFIITKQFSSLLISAKWTPIWPQRIPRLKWSVWIDLCRHLNPNHFRSHEFPKNLILSSWENRPHQVLSKGKPITKRSFKVWIQNIWPCRNSTGMPSSWQNSQNRPTTSARRATSHTCLSSMRSGRSSKASWLPIWSSSLIWTAARKECQRSMISWTSHICFRNTQRASKSKMSLSATLTQVSMTFKTKRLIWQGMNTLFESGSDMARKSKNGRIHSSIFRNYRQKSAIVKTWAQTLWFSSTRKKLTIISKSTYL